MHPGAGIKPASIQSPFVLRAQSPHPSKRKETSMSSNSDWKNGGPQMDRRGALECMLWALSGGIPSSMFIGDAKAAEMAKDGFTFLQISDSHVGFNKPENPNALSTLQEAINKIKAMPVEPSFMIHTGDITHLSQDKQFDDAAQVIGSAGLPVFYVPGEEDVIDEGLGKSYLARYGKASAGSGWYSFDQNGVHFIGLVNVMNLKAGGLGNLGDEQLIWLEND